MKKILLAVLSILVLNFNSFSQLGTYQFTGYTCAGTANVVSQPSNGTFSAFSRNTVDCNSVSNVFSSGNWSTGTSYDGNYYIQFTITANAGYYLTLSSLTFDQSRSGTGPQNARVAHNASGDFTTDYYNFTPVASTTNINWDFTDFNTLVGGTVTFRIYGWNMGNSSGKFQVDNVILNGSVIVAPPAPAANAGNICTICSGSSATMTGASASGTYGSVTWTGGEMFGTWSGSGSNPSTYQFTPIAPSGSFTATLTVNGNGVWAGVNSTSTRTISWHANGTWLGNVDNNWFTSSNWCTMPDANTNATILSGTAYQPTINADGAVCKNLTINSGATITINANRKLNIKGNLSNNGTAALGAGTVEFDGTNPQSITGSNTFTNLEINNSMMVGIYSGTQNVTGIVTLTNGILYTYGNPFVLKSTASSTAQIDGSGNGDIEGTLTVERYVPAAASSSVFNHLIASPLKTDSIVDTGLSGFSDDFTLIADNYNANPAGTFFMFNEAVSGTGSPFSYDCLRAPSQITNMTGYAAKITSATTLDITGTYKHHVAPIKNLTYTPGSGGNGWNLVGNPYPSSIDWDAPNAWVKQHITNSIYVWNPAAGQFTSYNGSVGTNGGSRYIAPWQSFFVVANDENPMVSVLHSARTTAPSTFFKAEEITELIRLKVNGSNYADETVVYFDINASEDLDGFDSYKVKSMIDEAPMLASKVGDENLSINALPGYFLEMVIPLTLNALAGNYSITASELLGFGGSNPAYLEDALTGNIVEITENFQLDFYHDENYPNRFSIKFDTPIATGVQEQTADVKIYQSNSEIVLETKDLNNEKGIITVYNSAGQSVVAAQQVNLGGRSTVSIPDVAAGMYVVNLQYGNEVKNQKLYVRNAPVF